jgi:chorismate dehydratase
MNPKSQIQNPKCRIGCVPYLNSKPLIFGIEDQVRLDVPSALARALREGSLDCALVPIVEYLEHPHYQILPGICIGSRGPVRSVYLAYRGPLSSLKKVFLDPSSRTSSLLLKVILGEFFALEPEYLEPNGTKPGPEDARLLIGDPALMQRARLIEAGWNLLDLGETWFDATDLPFVYACWLVREGLDAMPFLETLTRAREQGLENLEEIIRGEARFSEKMVRSYFKDAVRYDFGAEQIKGILEFQRLLKKRGLIAREAKLKLAA